MTKKKKKKKRTKVKVRGSHLKTLELHGEDVRGCLNGEALCRTRLLVALLALVLIVAVEFLRRSECCEALVERRALDFERQIQEGVGSVRLVVARGALHLTAEMRTKDLMDDAGLADPSVVLDTVVPASGQVNS